MSGDVLERRDRVYALWQQCGNHFRAGALPDSDRLGCRTSRCRRQRNAHRHHDLALDQGASRTSLTVLAVCSNGTERMITCAPRHTSGIFTSRDFGALNRCADALSRGVRAFDASRADQDGAIRRCKSQREPQPLLTGAAQYRDRVVEARIRHGTGTLARVGPRVALIVGSV